MNYISCSFQKFLSDTKDKNVLCYGSGSYYKVMCYDMSSKYPEMKLAGVIDNDKTKCGKTVIEARFKTEVYSIEEALSKFDFNDTIILITTSQLDMVKSHLKSIEKLKNTDVYSYFDLKKNSAVPAQELQKNTEKPLIPKKIHYCWFGKNKIPHKIQKCVDSWSLFCPDYEIKKWDESNYDVEKKPFLKLAYDRKKWASISDYARFDIVYHEGGFYFDTDVELIRSPDILRYNKGFIATEIIGGINSGSGLGAIKNHSALKKIKEAYDNEGWDFFAPNTGKETEFFYDNSYRINDKIQIVCDITILPFNVLSVKNVETNEIYINDATIALHHFDGSWR